MFGSLLAKNSAIAVEVGAAGLRAGQVRRTRGKISITDTLSIDLPMSDPASTDGSPSLDCARIARMTKAGAFCGRDVSLILSPPEVHFQPVAMPQAVLSLPEARVEAALLLEVTRESRLDPADLEVRHWLLPAGHREDANVMCVAISRSRVVDWAAQLERCGLWLRRVDVSPCALAKRALTSFKPTDDAIWGVLDIGVRRSVLTLLIGETPVYVRALQQSSGAWTQSIANAFEVSHSEAELIKRTVGLNSPGASARVNRAADIERIEAVGPLVFGLLNDSVQALIRSINLCFSYVLENYPKSSASRLMLAGGGAQLPGLLDYLREFLDLPVDLIAEESPNEGACGLVGPGQIELAGVVGAALIDLEGGA